MISFWCRLLEGHENKRSSILYKLLYINSINDGYDCKWISNIKSIFDNCGMSDTCIWHDQLEWFYAKQ